MKLYTKTGDDGTTGLFGGERVDKDHPRVEAYGEVDELNAAVGLAVAACEGLTGRPGDHAGPETGETVVTTRFPTILTTLQAALFRMGADLATPHDSKHASKIRRVDESAVAELEHWIDEIDGGNTPMTHFVLPGGSDLAARLHLARTICRRAERAIVTLAGNEAVTPATIVYLNRVGDLLFAMARRANRAMGIPDTPWIPD